MRTFAVRLALFGLLACLGFSRASAQDQKHGKAVFDLWCAGCHKPLGPYVSGVAGTSVLERKYNGEKPAALEERTDLDPATVKKFVRHGVRFMPFFRKTEISNSDLDDLAAYLGRNIKH